MLKILSFLAPAPPAKGLCLWLSIQYLPWTTHTYLAGEIPWSRRWFTQGEAQPLHSGCADPCEFPKCGNLDCIICGSGGLRSRSPLMIMLNGIFQTLYILAKRKGPARPWLPLHFRCHIFLVCYVLASSKRRWDSLSQNHSWEEKTKTLGAPSPIPVVLEVTLSIPSNRGNMAREPRKERATEHSGNHGQVIGSSTECVGFDSLALQVTWLTLTAVSVTYRVLGCSGAERHADSGFSSKRTSLSPFTKDFRGEDRIWVKAIFGRLCFVAEPLNSLLKVMTVQLIRQNPNVD